MAGRHGAAAYSDLADPQSLNLYTYVRNNPVSRTDPDGHCDANGKHCFWQKFKNWAQYGVFVSTSNLESSLAARPEKMQFARNYIQSMNPNITNAQLNAMTNVQIIDTANEMRLAQAEGAESSAALGLIYEGAPYHGKSQSGGKSPGPQNGQEALDNSVQVKDTSPRRVGVDRGNNEIVVLDQTSPGSFHGHVRAWGELTSEMQNALKNAGLVNANGEIIR